MSASLGLQFQIETDHKPLVSLFRKNLLDELPLQVQPFHMRVMRYSFSIEHVLGKHLSTADACAPIQSRQRETLVSMKGWCYVQLVISNLPATNRSLEKVRSLQDSDSVCKQPTFKQVGRPSLTCMTVNPSTLSLVSWQYKMVCWWEVVVCRNTSRSTSPTPH